MTKSRSRILFMLAITSFSAIFLILPSIPNSYAHALIVRSYPGPSQSLPILPSKVDVYFTDPVDIRYSEIKVLDPNGNEIQNKDEHYITSDQSALSVSLPAGLPNGVYTVSTKVLDQTDGHVTENGFVFAVGVAAPQSTAQSKIRYSDVISIPDTIARFPALIGQVIVVGAAFSTLWLWSPVSKIVQLEQRFAETRLKIDKRATMLILVGASIVFASGFGMIAAVAYSIHAGFLDAISTKFGQLWIVRMIVASALLGLALTIYFKQKKSNSILQKWHTAAILGVGLTVLSTTSIISHGAATGQVAPPLFDFIHNLAASLWIGGVIYIDFIIISKLKQLSDDRISSSILSIIIPKFSTVVLLILGTIIITGPFLLFLLESNLALTLASTYGKILIVKLSLAAVMMVMGGYHQFVVHKHALRNIASSSTRNGTVQDHQSKSILSKFRMSAKIESIAGIILIASVAALVDSGLPATEYQDILQSQQSNPLAFGLSPNVLQNVFTETRFVENGGRVVLSVDPYFIGSNDITISFLDSNRNPVDIQSVILELTQTDKSIGPIKVDTQQVSTGVYSAKTDSLTISGNWHAHVEGVPSSAGSLSLVADYDLNLKPKVSQLSANIQEYKLPDNKSLPLYPVYDTTRNVVWVGDTAIKSGKIIEFNLDSKKYTEHRIDRTNIITFTALDSQNKIWYVDPISKLLGHFNPADNSNQPYSVLVDGALSGLALDSAGNVWLTVSTTNELIKFNPGAKNFTSIKLATGSVPLGIAIDKSNGQIWVAESGTGKLANIDPSNNYKVTEYAPTQENTTLASPTAVLVDLLTNKVFVSEHDGTAVSAFDPLLKTFTRYQLDSQGLPFGTAFDGNHDLWIAQHTLNKIAVLDPRTGETNEFGIPSNSSFVQWITTDSHGDIIMAEQRANALGIVTTTTSLALSQTGQVITSPIPQLGFSYVDVVAPSIVAGLIAVAFIYSRSTLELKKSVKHVREIFS